MLFHGRIRCNLGPHCYTNKRGPGTTKGLQAGTRTTRILGRKLYGNTKELDKV